MNLKSQKGSITLFVLVSCLFFIASVACVNMYIQSKQTAVDREYRQVKANYEKDINNMESIYRDLSRKNNLEVQFGVPEIDKENKKINVSVFTNLEYLKINTLKYGWDYSNNLSSLSTDNISNWTYVEHQNGENEFIASIDFKKDTNENDIVYYYLSVVVDNKEFGTTVSYYVDDKMILHYDGINNVGLGDKKHSLNATTWKNLCDGIDAAQDGVLSTTGTTGPTWGNDYLSFDGIDDWVNAGVIDSDYQSIEVVYSIGDININRFRSIFGDWESAGGGISVNSENKPYGEFYIGGYKSVFADGYIVDQKYNSTITYDSHKVVFYINGNKIGEQVAEGGIIKADDNTVMSIGANPQGNSIQAGYYFKGKVYSARVYTRALSANEVKQNYIVDKNRFKIQD